MALLGAIAVVSAEPLHAQPARAIDDLTQALAIREDNARFRAAIADALAANPLVAQRRANGAEAEAARREARSAVLPTIDLAVSANRAIAREFSNDPDNVIERSRGPGRADVSASINQILFDFGAAGRRIAAASARIDAARAEIDLAYEDVALRAVGAWIDVAAYARLTELTQDHLAAQHSYRPMLQSRIDQGVSAVADQSRLDAAIATSEQRLARFSQQLGNAEARFGELFGSGVLLPRLRPPAFAATGLDVEEMVLASQSTAPVRSARAQAQGARADARAARSDTLPSVGIGLDAGRFGIFEPGRTDYDVRARVTLRYRLFGPGDARADQASARASAAQLRSDAVLREAEREARIAVLDVEALAQSNAAFETEYRASQVTRNAEIARFRIARGTMFDVLAAEERYFGSAINYLRSTIELDAARFVLLARIGALLPKLGIVPDYDWQRR